MNEPVTAHWEAIDDWLRTHAPGSFHTLRGPATGDALTQLEETLGASLNQDAKACLRTHNGAIATQGAHFLPRNYRPVSAEESRKLLKENNEILGTFDDEDMVGYWWHPLWLPFAEHPSTDLLFVDHRPETHGQVGHFDHEDSATLQWPDLTAFLTHAVDSFTRTDSDGFHPDVTQGLLVWRPAT